MRAGQGARRVPDGLEPTNSTRGYLRSRSGVRARQCSARAPREDVLVWGPEKRAKGPGVIRDRSGDRWCPASLEEGGDPLPARGQRSQSRGWWRSGSPGSACGEASGRAWAVEPSGGRDRSLGMLTREELRPPRSLRRCERSLPSPRCVRRRAPRAQHGRRYLCGIRRDLGAGGTRREGRRAACRSQRNFPLPGAGNVRAPLLQAPASLQPRGAGIWLSPGSSRPVLVTAVFTPVPVSLKSSV